MQRSRGGAQVFNRGVGGEMTPAGLNRFAGTLSGTAANGAVIMEATNDVSQGLAASLTAFNLQQMATLAVGFGATTLIANVLPRDEQGFGGSDNAATNVLNARIPAAAAAAGASLVDAHGPFVGRGDLFADHTHPTPGGYDFLGGLVFNAINALPAEGGDSATTAPGSPGQLQVVVNNSTVTMSWNAPASGGTPTSYRIQAGSVPFGNDLADFNTGNSSTSFTATNVGNATFNITVRAVNAVGTSAQSDNVVGTVGGGTNVCTATAGVPGGLTASSNGSRVTLRWTPGPGQNATSYRIEAGSAAGQSNLAIINTGNSATTFVADGVASGTYFVRVRAINACGISAASGEAILIVS